MTPVEKMVQRFMVSYGPPDTIDLEKFVGEYRSALRRASDDLLKAAVDRVIREHRFRNWPTVGDVLAALRSVSLDIERENERRLNSVPPPVREEPSAASKERVGRMAEEAIARLRSVSSGKPPGELVRAPNRDEWSARQEFLRDTGQYHAGAVR